MRRQTDMHSGAFITFDLHGTLFLRLIASGRMKWAQLFLRLIASGRMKWAHT